MNEHYEQVKKCLEKISYDLTEFFKENNELFEVYDIVESRGYVTRTEASCMQELRDSLDQHIRFRSNYNWGIEAYL